MDLKVAGLECEARSRKESFNVTTSTTSLTPVTRLRFHARPKLNLSTHMEKYYYVHSRSMALLPVYISEVLLFHVSQTHTQYFAL